MILKAACAPLDGERLCKAFEIDGLCILASIYAVDDACVDVWLDADVELSDAQCAAAYERIAYYVRLSDTYATPFEAVFSAILAQRFSTPLARKIKDRVTLRWGTSIVREGVTHRAFPSALRLRVATDDELRRAGIPSTKLRYVRSAIEAFTRIEERWLRQAPAAEVRAWLRAVAGLGRMQVDGYLRLSERAFPAVV